MPYGLLHAVHENLKCVLSYTSANHNGPSFHRRFLTLNGAISEAISVLREANSLPRLRLHLRPRLPPLPSPLAGLLLLLLLGLQRGQIPKMVLAPGPVLRLGLQLLVMMMRQIIEALLESGEGIGERAEIVGSY
ncbi:hypothetical protein H5410_034169 [Solanum commersonii]|uniref:Uncharacterized protein n=1 Tax=Solanum commersonii TaxID=4109 RepID=A0A9J5YSN1_SOLCO|nr:hypothetical protein H5410_034169 [Solanum commersonii]